MKNKKRDNIPAALEPVRDGDTIFFGGFGTGGVPIALIRGLTDKKLSNLTIVSNNAGAGHNTIATLLESGSVKKVICTFPYSRGSVIFNDLYHSGKIELELVPQGTLAERMRAAGSGLGGFLTPTGLGTEIAEGKPHIDVDGKTYVLEKALRADIALIKAHNVDPRGNLTYRLAARNFNPVMAMAAEHTIAQVSAEVPLGEINPEIVHTPGIYVDSYVIDDGEYGE